MEVKEALEILDHSDDSQWTTDGLPLVDTLRQITGKTDLTRAEITDANPSFRRIVGGPVEIAGDEAVVDETDPFDAIYSDEPGTDAVEIVQGEQSEIDYLREQVATLTNHESAGLSAIRDIQSELTKIQADRDNAQNRLDTLESRSKTDNPFRQYVESQDKLRRERAGLRQKILGGLTADDIPERSVLDEAMRRRTNPNANRRPFAPK